MVCLCVLVCVCVKTKKNEIKCYTFSREVLRYLNLGIPPMRWSRREYAFISGWTPPHERIHKAHGHSAWAWSGGIVACMVRNGVGAAFL